MKKLFSYIWPQTRKVDSDYSGVLEITLTNGRKILDSKNANYSYGSLQRILEAGLLKINLKKVSSVLLLGLGGGSVIASLRNKFNYKGRIASVELDKKIIAIAQKEFHVSASDKLSIENCDAFDFVKTCQNRYDLVVVDLFIDNKVPEQFYTNEFCDNLSKIMNKKGAALFNLGINQNNKEKRERVINYFRNVLNIRTSKFENVAGTNTLIVLNKAADNP